MVHTPPSTPDESLALALVVASHAPLLLLDGGLQIIVSSQSFDDAYRFARGETRGHLVRELGSGEWSAPQLHSLLSATLTGFADVVDYEMDLQPPGGALRRVVLNAARITGDNTMDAQLLLSVVDVTAIRLADKTRDDLLREKEILLRELQHRVANSLQIIASVLMQSARRVQSEETRMALTSAHGRVLSIAAVQQQLADTTLSDVNINAYLVQLCESLGASMISDGSVTLQVDADSAMIGHNVSIRLGLVATELVINALKHAFPDQRTGTILVRYETDGSEWTLSITDDGVGMPSDDIAAKPGLGTSIVQALAQQLEADVIVTRNSPGTTVSIIHSDVGPGNRGDSWLV